MSGLLCIYYIQGFSTGKHVRVVVYIQGFSTGKYVRVVVYIIYRDLVQVNMSGLLYILYTGI